MNMKATKRTLYIWRNKGTQNCSLLGIGQQNTPLLYLESVSELWKPENIGQILEKGTILVAISKERESRTTLL